MTVQASSTATWDEIVQRDALRASSPEPQGQTLVPLMAGPAPRAFGSSPAGAPVVAGPLGPPSAEASPLAPVLSTNFLALPDINTVIPPDTNGAVGPNHVVTMLNSQFRIQDKAGGVISTVSLATFWSACSGTPYDPRVVYDSIHGRWIATCDANANTASSKVLFAISNTNDPTGTWTFYCITADSTGATWADFPGFGVNTNWIAITNNMYTVAGSPLFQGAKMWVIDKSSALVPGGPITVTTFPTAFDTAGGASGFTLRPCVTFGPQSILYMVDNSGWSFGGTFLMRISQITGTGPAPTWSVIPGGIFPGTGFFLVLNNFDFGQINACQLGSSLRVQTNDPRICASAFYRNGKIWCAHSGGLPVSAVNRTAVFWYQINPGGMPTPIVQSGVLDGGADVHHFFPSITANMNDDVCLGFSRSSCQIYVQGAYAVRVGTDPLGTMGPISVLKAGEDSYVKDYGSGRIRWGDYSATVVDPADDQTLWTLQEYAALGVGPNPSDDRWGTWWGAINPCLPLTISSSVSRKTHGTCGDFDVPSGSWEGRVPSTAQQGPSKIVTVFNQGIQRVNSTAADFTFSSGTLGTITISTTIVTNDTLTVNLTNIANKATFTIGYPGIAAACDVGNKTTATNCWVVLAGEASGPGTGSTITVNTSDYVSVRGRIGPGCPTDFRKDVNCSGAIDTSDYVSIRGRIDPATTLNATCP